jgi:hypothetical protein
LIGRRGAVRYKEKKLTIFLLDKAQDWRGERESREL